MRIVGAEIALEENLAEETDQNVLTLCHWLHLGKENARSFYLSSGFLLGNKNVKAQKGEDEFGSSGVFE